MTTPSSIWTSDLTLRRWFMQDFKAVRRADVELAPLTVVVGANSAGKSTLIQSIRAVVQAGYTQDATFPLNGEQVRLGTFAETIWSGALHVGEETPTSVRFGAAFAYRPGRAKRSRAWPERTPPARSPLHRAAAQLDFSWAIRLSGSPPGQPALAWLDEMSLQDRASIGGEPLTLLGERKQQSSRLAGRLVGEGTKEKTFSSLSLRGAFPVNATAQRALLDPWIETWLSVHRRHALDRVRSNPRSAARASNRVVEVRELAGLIAEDIRDFLDSFTPEEIRSAAFDQRDRSEIRARALSREPVDFRLAATDLSSLVGHVEREIGTPYGDRAVALPQTLTNASQLARDFFATQVLHLGPLRENPQVLYLNSPVIRSNYLGDKGEYTAAVLQTQGRDEVDIPLPGGRHAALTARTTLVEGVNAWSSYLGIAEEFSTVDEGRLGIRLRVRQKNLDLSLDLTSVGTGVSQLLPVVVLCLQAPVGSLLLVEQPELHLHPIMQQRLADFLLAIASSGRQLIVETHSDFLINRLRLRAMQNSSDRVSERVVFVFAERKDGVTSYTSTHPTVDGSMPSWPAGFLDQTARESERMLHTLADMPDTLDDAAGDD